MLTDLDRAEMITGAASLPLFPLGTVLFPNTLLPLRIFESRYIDLIRDCMRDDTGFGVVPIRKGREVGTIPEVYEVGTVASIVEWSQGSDGLLNVTVRGGRRFRIESQSRQANNLLIGNVGWITEPEPAELPASFVYLGRLLDQLGQYESSPAQAASRVPSPDAASVVYGLAARLPLSLDIKSEILTSTDLVTQLGLLDAQLRRLTKPA